MAANGGMDPTSDRRVGGAYIPAHVLFAEGLSPRAKILYGRIHALQDPDRGCYASNEFLGDAIGVDPETVTRYLHELTKRGFLEREFVHVGDKVERRLYAAGFPMPATPPPSPREAPSGSFLEPLRSVRGAKRWREMARRGYKVEHTEEEWEKKLDEFSWKCAYCGCQLVDRDQLLPDTLTRAYIIPLSQGGSDHIDNVVPACWACSSKKGASLYDVPDDPSGGYRMTHPVGTGSPIRVEIRIEDRVERSQNTMSGLPDTPPATTSATSPPAAQVLEALNRICGRQFRPTKANMKNINGRLAEKWSVDDLILVIEYKHAQWGKDDVMREYLRPQTLFGPEKFPGYIAAAREWHAKGRPNVSRNGQGRAPQNVVAPEDDLMAFVRGQYGKTKEA